MGKAEHHAILIRAAISAARADGVRVTMDHFEDDDGLHVKLTTREQGAPDWSPGWIVEGY
jgi:uncharacterized membrane protein YebE (DUF533 family)